MVFDWFAFSMDLVGSKALPNSNGWWTAVFNASNWRRHSHHLAPLGQEILLALRAADFLAEELARHFL